MPSVVIRCLIDLRQLVLGWINPVGSMLSRITGNVTKQDRGVAYYRER